MVRAQLALAASNAPNRAVLIQLIGVGSSVPEDREDVRRLAAHVRLVGLPVLPGPRTQPADPE